MLQIFCENCVGSAPVNLGRPDSFAVEKWSKGSCERLLGQIGVASGRIQGKPNPIGRSWARQHTAKRQRQSSEGKPTGSPKGGIWHGIKFQIPNANLVSLGK